MKIIKLMNPTLIKSYGKDTLSASDFENITKIQISGDGSKMDTYDARTFEADLLSIFKLAPATYEIQLKDIDMTNISINWLLKEVPYIRMSFPGSDDIFKKLKNTEVNFSNLTRSAFGFDDDAIVNELDLFENLKIQKRFNLLPIVDVKDLDLILKYIDISEIKIKIRTPEDFEKIESLANGPKIELCLSVNDLKRIENLRNKFNYNINLNINDMSELSIEDLEFLNGYNINLISIEQDLTGAKDNVHELHLGIISNSKEKYDLETYIKLRKAVDEIIEGIDVNSPDIQKFLTIYKKLGSTISYDFSEEEDSIDNPLSHNLVGGLLNNVCVCEGYSKILKQCLACVGIDSKVIIGYASLECHAWNQVKLDNVWYNTDLTWDSVNLKENIELDYCLQDDVEFIDHSMESFIASPCMCSYDRNYMHKYLGIPFAFSFEDKYYTPSDIITLIRKLNENSNNGTSISIYTESDTNNYKMYFGNIIDDDMVKWSETHIKISPENLASFIQEYSKSFQVSQIQASSAFSELIKTNEGIQMKIDETIKADMLNYGVSIDKLLRVPKQNMTSLINISPMNIWSKITSSVKNTFQYIKQSLFTKKETAITDDKHKEPSKYQESFYWNLRNWQSNDELELSTIQSKKKIENSHEQESSISDVDDLTR